MKRLLLLPLFLLFACLAAPTSSSATELYAQQTGKSCNACHVDPAGGGELTAAGKEFAASRAVQNEAPRVAPAAKVVRFLAGYLHMLTAILWFGTILYVHLVLKPAYAAGGLPRGEVKVGVLSMVVMGITGTLLTHFRVTSLDMLLHTRFGVLLLVKIFLYLVMVLSATYVVLFIGPKLKAKRREPVALPVGKELTLDELSSFDGKEGRPAYFACEGKLYDATGSRLWKQGVHMGRHHAGEDLSEALKLAPHGAEKVLLMPEVGALADVTQRKAPLHERVFFFMAYMNLTIVFLIVLILSLWRWA
ncbi:cytochrome b5 domain-containing protein [Geomonas subterranea]|uniref:cytochrome b5 domain-containing protein n=1 Tax=Geomonas subterranea TaxID=2847989 RepID=UPI001CD22BAA|nr:cytochrome b5 domain-containing protein [Geomonas fuzhouensis]